MCRVLALAVLVAFLAPAGDCLAKDESKTIKELGRKVQIIDQKRRTEEQRLRDLDRTISSTQEEISSARETSKAIGEKIATQRAQIRKYQKALSQSQGSLRQKWIALYKGAYLDMVDVQYTHAEYAGYIDAIISRNKEELSEYHQTKDRLLDAKERLDDASTAQKENLKELEGKIGTLSTEHEKKASLLASLRSEKKTYEEQIQRLLKKLQERKTEVPNRGMAKRMGDLPWPVQGTIVRGFGITKEEGYAQISHGVDIEAEEGAPVKTIHAGTVAYYSWIPKFGNTMIIDHGGGLFSVYGHLQKALKSNGDTVNAREDVALVGQSGDVMKPTLHFEIRYKDKPQDPVRWLSRQQ
ncbi:MAG TPA: peptidoglycan DD-metalloendopeptidase family protein [Deltaproteobacteria bacterium]|nr:peptidoglycan DD-metalloendopeptidase family protein [Deltaproteobacteria bacterium]HPR55694.1 peptidoglycan DD-metalloendopeptidase family protein [Deltaproteobacteria bacterium]